MVPQPRELVALAKNQAHYLSMEKDQYDGIHIDRGYSEAGITRLKHS